MFPTIMVKGGGGGHNGSLQGIIDSLSLDTNLQLTLDAGDSNSYVSGQTWSDAHSTGMDFYLGETSGSEASDPTFNGSSGGLSSDEYFSFDGGDYCKVVGSNPAWVETCHKDAATFSLIFFVYPTGLADVLCATKSTNTTSRGFQFVLGSGNVLQLMVADGTATIPLSVSSTSTFNSNAWNMVGVSVNENGGAGASHWYINGAEETFNAAYNGPTTLNASHDIDIGRRCDGVNYLTAGTRLSACAMFNTNLTAANFDSIWDEMRTRYGL